MTAVYVDGSDGWVELHVCGRHVADVPACRRPDASPGDAEAVAAETVAELVGRVLYMLGHREAYPGG